MTQAFRLLCPKVVVLLEGGYDLNALEVSSEAVVQTLRIHPQDTQAIDSYLHSLHLINLKREAEEDPTKLQIDL